MEGLVEECDSPGEYFYDAAGQALYYTFNGTENGTVAPTGEEDFALTVAKVIFNISGTQGAPVRCVATILMRTVGRVYSTISSCDWQSGLCSVIYVTW